MDGYGYSVLTLYAVDIIMLLCHHPSYVLSGWCIVPSSIILATHPVLRCCGTWHEGLDNTYRHLNPGFTCSVFCVRSKYSIGSTRSAPLSSRRRGANYKVVSRSILYSLARRSREVRYRGKLKTAARLDYYYIRSSSKSRHLFPIFCKETIV